MKELSIEEKAQRYDEAIERAKLYKGLQAEMEFIFPELKESEDERIRKWIIGILSTYEHDRDLRNAAIAYLEKQGEQKSAAWSEEDNQIALSIEQVMNCASLLNIVPEKMDKIRTWLKSLKDRYTWKPSDEQMKVLNEVINFAADHGTMRWNDYIYNVLKGLREQLKKL